jgi:hypothetical protein
MRVGHTIYFRSKNEVLLIKGKSIICVSENRVFNVLELSLISAVFFVSLDLLLLANVINAHGGNKATSFTNLA